MDGNYKLYSYINSSHRIAEILAEEGLELVATDRARFDARTADPRGLLEEVATEVRIAGGQALHGGRRDLPAAADASSASVSKI